eukprot:scaffold14931_cov19-Tisochrysis_lutea.AAC.3
MKAIEGQTLLETGQDKCPLKRYTPGPGRVSSLETTGLALGTCRKQDEKGIRRCWNRKRYRELGDLQ